MRANEFPESVQRLALGRQRFRCGSCGTPIAGLGTSGQASHAYGEAAHAHHMKKVMSGGLPTVENCVILCSSCHYSAHEGGNYRCGTVKSEPQDFPYFNG